MRKQYEWLLFKVAKEAQVPISEKWVLGASDYAILQKLNDCLIRCDCIPMTFDEMEHFLD